MAMVYLARSIKYIFIYRHLLEDGTKKGTYCYDVDMVKKKTIHEAQRYGEERTGTENIFVGELSGKELKALYYQGRIVKNTKLLKEVKKKLDL